MYQRKTLRGLVHAAFFLMIATTWSCSDSTGPQDTLGPPSDPKGGQSNDTVSPQAINDARLSWNGNLVLDWTAPWDDLQSEPVTSYEIRYSYSFFDSTGFWDQAESIADPPSPGQPGAWQEYVFPDVERRRTHVALRSRDEAGNLSPLSNIASFTPPGYTFAGSCVGLLPDADPVEGLQVDAVVELAPFPPQQYSTHTDAGGGFMIEDIPKGASLTVTISDGQSGMDFHGIEAPYVVQSDQDETFTMVDVDRNLIDTSFGTVLNLLTTLYSNENSYYVPPTTLRPWRSFPVEVHVPPNEGATESDFPLELDEGITQGINLWNTVWIQEFGVPLFNLVYTTELPSEGIYILPWCDPNTTHRGLTTLKGRNQAGDCILWQIQMNTCKIGPRPDLDVAHELAHTFPWGHVNGNHLMNPNSGDLSQDDIKAAVLMFKLPYGTDLSIYDLVPSE